MTANPTSKSPALTAVVTGASSGIGAETARQLTAAGYRVVLAARRTDRIEELAAELGGVAVTTDVTDPASVARLAEAVGPRLDLLVNNAGGAFGSAPVSDADADDWRRMFDVNVVGVLSATQALLPALVAAGGEGRPAAIINVGSIAGRRTYEGGGGYNAAKFGLRALTEALRLEIVDQPVRVMEIAPGMVKTDEFSLVRFDGDQDRADAVYAGVPEPLLAADIADAIVWMATRPAHVNIDELVIKPRVQAAPHKVHRV